MTEDRTAEGLIARYGTHGIADLKIQIQMIEVLENLIAKIDELNGELEEIEQVLRDMPGPPF